MTGNISRLHQHTELGPVCYTAVADCNEKLWQFGEVYVCAHTHISMPVIYLQECVCVCFCVTGFVKNPVECVGHRVEETAQKARK